VSATDRLLAREDLAVLARLSLESLDALLTGLGGEREGPGRSAGFEFIDYRRYTPGDDVRRIDWNVYMRLRELHVRTAPREARVALAVLVDASRSMQGGSPSRLRYALRIAALLGAVALLHGDAVQVHVLSDGDAISGGIHDNAATLLGLAQELDHLPAGITTDLAASVRKARDLSTDSELAVLISDMLVPATDRARALRELGSGTRSATLLHVTEVTGTLLADGEAGDVRLFDSETGEGLEVTLDDELWRRYSELQDAFPARVREACRPAGVRYLRAPVSVEPLDLVLDQVRSGMLLRAAGGR
jgi:uncharacterized protein (DUF58 family)